MNAIVLDTVQMDATAGAVGEHAREIQTSVDTLETSCSADVPVSLAGWLADELHEIATTARMIALVYTMAALDTAFRAQQIQADQSLVAATPALVPVATQWTPVVGGSLYPDEVDTGLRTVMYGPSTETFLANNPLLAAASNLQSTNPAAAAQLMGLHSGLQGSQDLSIGRDLNSRPGATWVGPGLFEGAGGRIGSQIYADPNRPGHFLVD